MDKGNQFVEDPNYPGQSLVLTFLSFKFITVHFEFQLSHNQYIYGKVLRLTLCPIQTLFISNFFSFIRCGEFLFNF